jgi:ABC-type amino acid transport system permease subunit
VRAAITGMGDVKVPSWRSILATSCGLVASVLVLTASITLVDGSLLEGHFNGGLGALRPVAGMAALGAMVLSVVLAIALPLNASDVDRRLTTGQRRRLRVALGALIASLCLGYLWSLGAAV